MIRTTLSLAAFAAAASFGLAACQPGEREAEAETPVAAAEVETSLPESTVSDQELQQAADQAAAQASTPAAGTTMPATGAAGTTGMTGTTAGTTGTTTTTTNP